ncbi:unnamed protein product [Paramecium primaurelia]|uniref:Uncharacterized protein n=1 Tax=Paramecium primaurelia TaxID=5886 RepID=A0A8S1M3U1_PARPR|nr:unnamed protein product [Paramecium primaurelia]
MITSVRQSENRKLLQNKKSQNQNPFKRAQSQFKQQLIKLRKSIICQSFRTISHVSTQEFFQIRRGKYAEYNNLKKFDILVYKNTSQDPLICFNYDDFKGVLPVTINGIKFLKIDWSYFIASPNISSQQKAHCFWTVGYKFDINMKKMKRSQNIKYRLIIQSWCCFSNQILGEKQMGQIIRTQNWTLSNWMFMCFRFRQKQKYKQRVKQSRQIQIYQELQNGMNQVVSRYILVLFVNGETI